MNVDFGGTAGKNLPLLTRMVAHMQGNDAPIVGFTFFFDGQEPLLFGRQGRTEISFPIDGHSGERISSVVYEQASSSVGIWSIKVCRLYGQ